MPTALAAAGVTVRPEWQIDGFDLVPRLAAGAAAPRPEAEPVDRPLFWRFGDQMAIRSGNWKLVRYALNYAGEIRDPAGPPKVLPMSPLRLYDLGRDVGEANDLAASHPAKVAELRATWDRWSGTLAEPLWGWGGAPPAEPKKGP